MNNNHFATEPEQGEYVTPANPLPDTRSSIKDKLVYAFDYFHQTFPRTSMTIDMGIIVGLISTVTLSPVLAYDSLLSAREDNNDPAPCAISLTTQELHKTPLAQRLREAISTRIAKPSKHDSSNDGLSTYCLLQNAFAENNELRSPPEEELTEEEPELTPEQSISQVLENWRRSLQEEEEAESRALEAEINDTYSSWP